MLCFLDWSFLLFKSYKISIMLRSGDWAGQESCGIWFRVLYSIVDLVQWSGALSSWKIQPHPGKYCATTGQRLSSKISRYLFALLYPSTDATVPGPNHEMHPHIMTWNFGRGFCETRSDRQPSPAFLHTYTLSSLPNIILLSSEKNDFYPIIFDRPSPLFHTPREPLFSITSFFLVTLRLKPLSCK